MKKKKSTISKTIPNYNKIHLNDKWGMWRLIWGRPQSARLYSRIADVHGRHQLPQNTLQFEN